MTSLPHAIGSSSTAFARPVDAKHQRELLERAEVSHATLVGRLRDAFVAGKATCTEDPNGVDILACWADEAVIVEVKSTWGGFVRPVRNAVAQLYEYRYHLDRQGHLRANQHLVVALDRAPRLNSWLHDYLTRDRGMNLLWQTSDARLLVEGPAAELISRRVPQISAAQ